MVRRGKPGRRRTTWNGKRKTRLSGRVKSSQEGKMRRKRGRRDVGKIKERNERNRTEEMEEGRRLKKERR